MKNLKNRDLKYGAACGMAGLPIGYFPPSGRSGCTADGSWCVDVVDHQRPWLVGHVTKNGCIRTTSIVWKENEPENETDEVDGVTVSNSKANVCFRKM